MSGSRLFVLCFALGDIVVAASCRSAPTAIANTAPPAAVPSAPSTAPPSVEKKVPPRALLIYSGAPGELLPPSLRQALGEKVHVPSGGALSAAAQTLIEARQALGEMRCSEILPALSQATERVLGEAMLPDARPLLSELFGWMLLCADRINDSVHANKASAALWAMQATVPADVAPVLGRYPAPPRFGPPRAPVHVESDPPGAVVLRNLVPVGMTPLDVLGGQPERDFLDIELPGFRKQHRALGSNQQVILSLRPEDRVPVLFDRAALFPAGSDDQEAVLRGLAATAGAEVLPSHLLLAVGPKPRSGPRTAEEALLARVYDLERKAWVGPISEIAAGAPAAQSLALIALCDLTASGSGSAPKTEPLLPNQTTQSAKPAGPAKKKSWLPFANTKWYTWVVAGGVVALIAGLLIAEKVSPEKLTVSATH